MPGGGEGGGPAGIKAGEMLRGTITRAAARDFTVDPAERQRAIAFIQRRLPGLRSDPVNEVTCLFTETASEDFILDRRGPPVIASASSRHAAKSAPLTRENLANSP